MVAGGGITVVDVDGPAGEASLVEFDLPRTVEARTGRGRHLYFRGDAPSRVGVREGVDIRGEGSYVVVPPSRHISGVRYEWVNHPQDVQCAAVPDALKEIIDRPSRGDRTATTATSTPADGETIRKGRRNNELFKRACLLASFASSEAEIEAALLAYNSERCRPPLGSDEVARIARSAASSGRAYLTDRQLLDQAIAPHALATYLSIRSMSNQQGVCIASHDQIAELAGVSPSYTKQHGIRALEDAGLIDVKRPGPIKLGQPLNANEYLLTNPTTPTRNTVEHAGTPCDESAKDEPVMVTRMSPVANPKDKNEDTRRSHE